MSEWKEYKLGDICRSIADGDHMPPPKSDRGIPFVTISNIVDNRLDFGNTHFVPQSYYDGLDDKRRPHIGDTIYSVVGTFGKPVYVNDNKPFVFQRHIAILRPDESKIVPQFLYYSLLSPQFYRKADVMAVGAVQRTISLTSLRKSTINIPSLNIQSNIVSILSSLDDKIAVNKKICENLEAQAQALFKHWFVDFAPFFAEQSGEAERKDGQFVESELGLIHEGWKVGTLGDIAELRKPSIKPQDNILYTHYSIPAFDNNKKPSIDEGSTIKSNKFGINDGAVLLSKLNPSTKRIWYTGNVPENSVSSTEFLPFYSINKEYTPFIYCYLNCDSNYREIANGAKGTTNSHQRIDANSILNHALAYSEEAIRDFCDCCQSLMEMILESNQESFRLASLRDILLPKLMSGEIKVNDVNEKC